MAKDYLWWKHGVMYQIYPRSFCDSNGDGVGDIPGIISKLDYIAGLGVDGVWLSPINASPMYDFGYDISDYRAIDPVFGTDKDFNTLLKEAHRRGIRIIMDLVANHTSHLHPWFIESRSSKNNPKRDWYIWHDGKNGKPPNNWLAAFGGGAWEWDEATGQYYLHSFLKEQPDVNWRNAGLRKAMFGEIKYWLDRGVDGFRLDVVNYFVKDDQLRNNPFGIGRTPRPYDMQKHLYDRNRLEIHDILKDFRRLLDRYNERMSVGEVYSEDPDSPLLAAGFVGDGMDELHLAFNFAFVFKKWNAASFLDGIRRWDAAVPGKGWPCYVLSNHDQPRAISRYEKGGETLPRARIAAALLLTTRGTPFIYYGEEIGMKNGKIPHGRIVDPIGKKYWPFHPGRDPERTPMQWSQGPNSGFTMGAPWLPVNKDFASVNVEAQEHDSGSLLNFYMQLLALRREKAALNRGQWLPAEGPSRGVLSYYRVHGSERIFIALNFSSSSKKLKQPGGALWKVLYSTHKPAGDVYQSIEFSVAPYEVTLLEETT